MKIHLALGATVLIAALCGCKKGDSAATGDGASPALAPIEAVGSVTKVMSAEQLATVDEARMRNASRLESLARELYVYGVKNEHVLPADILVIRESSVFRTIAKDWMHPVTDEVKPFRYVPGYRSDMPEEKRAVTLAFYAPESFDGERLVGYLGAKVERLSEGDFRKLAASQGVDLAAIETEVARLEVIYTASRENAGRIKALLLQMLMFSGDKGGPFPADFEALKAYNANVDPSLMTWIHPETGAVSTLNYIPGYRDDSPDGSSTIILYAPESYRGHRYCGYVDGHVELLSDARFTEAMTAQGAKLPAK